MQLGIHLPQAGSQATPELIRRHARQAEDLGLSDIWVSEHIIVPRKQFPRSPLFYDPILTLTWVAAVTERVRLGTSVIVLPMRHPLPLAKELSTLQNLSGGRLILGVGVGWLEAEFNALGVPFQERGRRMDEGIAMMRAVWSEDPVTFEAKYIPAVIDNMRMQPKPEKPIPIWIGGTSEPALERALRLDGWHGSRATPEQAAPIVARLRARRPEPEFAMLALGRPRHRHDEGARRRLCRGWRAAHHGASARPRSGRLGYRPRRRRQTRRLNLTLRSGFASAAPESVRNPHR